MGKLIIEGNSVYEVDEECMRKREQREESWETAQGAERETGPHKDHSKKKQKRYEAR